MTSDPLDDLRERPRGVLSHADRKYLIGPEIPSRQAAHARKSAILDRTTESLRDGWLLAHYLPDEDVKRIRDRLRVGGEFHELRPTPPELREGSSSIEGVAPHEVRSAPGEMHRGLVGMIALLWRLYGDDEAAFERLVAEGVRAGISETRAGRWSADVSIEPTRIEEANVPDVIERLEAGEHNSLNDLEREVVISRLASKGALDLDALRETVSRRELEAAERADPDKFDDAELEPSGEQDAKYVKRSDGEFVKLDELDKELHELDEDRFEQLDETDKE